MLWHMGAISGYNTKEISPSVVESVAMGSPSAGVMNWSSPRSAGRVRLPAAAARLPLSQAPSSTQHAAAAQKVIKIRLVKAVSPCAAVSGRKRPDTG